jgi:hypothetical protein
VHIKTPVTISGLGRVTANQILALTGAEALPLIAAGKATPDPELDELKERARKLGQNVDWAEQECFKRPRTAIASFASKLKSAIVAQAGRRSCEHHAKTRSQITPRARFRRLRVSGVG